MSEEAFIGLIFWALVAVLVYWHSGRKIAAASPREATVGRRSGRCSEEFEVDVGPRRPYINFGGVLREVLHRESLGGDKVLCTLRPLQRGGVRLKREVPKADIIWAEKGVRHG